MLKPISLPGEALRIPASQAVKTTTERTSKDFRAALCAADHRNIAFSKHAIKRAEERGITVDDTLLGQLGNSLERAEAKGATNILAFDATRAFILNVPNGRVITAMSQEEMKENIFTNIDGAVIL